MSATLALTHPAKYSPSVIWEIRAALATYVPTGPLARSLILDPFAGVGGIHQLQVDEYDTVGVELEPEWAKAHCDTIVGDATALPFPAGMFDAIVTSPCYGNRMADTYRGEHICPGCSGTGWQAGLDTRPATPLACERCEGLGKVEPSKRYTYTIALGRELSDGSAAGLQWGDEYRRIHELAWAEASRVCRRGGVLLLNISDHVRGGDLQGVPFWHLATITAAGFNLVASRPIRTHRARNGKNREARAECEWLLIFRREAR